MTYNVFSGTLNPAQSVNESILIVLNNEVSNVFKMLFGYSSFGAPRPLSLFLWLQLHPAPHLQTFDGTNCSRYFLSLFAV